VEFSVALLGAASLGLVPYMILSGFKDAVICRVNPWFSSFGQLMQISFTFVSLTRSLHGNRKLLLFEDLFLLQALRVV
jgi:hypothetical protein